jgi:von Willebrand factor type A domain
MEQSTIISRENIISSVLLQFHTGATPRLIPILEPQDPIAPDDTSSENVAPPTPPKEDPFTYDFDLFLGDKEMKFGTLEVKISDTPILQEPQTLDANVDISGSMDDACKDGRTKMQHATHTLKNIVSAVASNPEASVAMATFGFDEKVETIFQDTQITKESVDALRASLDGLKPRGSTDIYQPLEKQLVRCNARQESTPGLRQTNITLTDGQANYGNTNYSDMATQVAPNCANVFIGFGRDHNALGLQQLADAQPNGSYFYIAEIEKAGLVFGEVIHQMLYTALTDITIHMENAEIYNYKTNEWRQELSIPSIVSEATKTYHVRSKTPDTAMAKIYAVSAVHNESEPSLISDDNTTIPSLLDGTTDAVIPRDLSVYMLRQRTQELIFKAHQHSIIAVPQKQDEYSAYREEGKTIRKQLVDYCKFMKQYSKENSLENNELLNSLITDIVVILKTFGGPRAALYSLARGGSQGRQTSNNTSYIDPNDFAYCRGPQRIPRTGGLRRQNAIRQDQDLDANEDEEYLGELPDLSLPQPLGIMRTNTTPRQITLMRSLTGGQQIAELDGIMPPPLRLPSPVHSAEDAV